MSSVIGILVGSLQGYFGGMVDLLGQRFVEIWSGLPILFVLIILASMVEPNVCWLLAILSAFSWMALVGVVRAEFLPSILNASIATLTALDFLGFGLTAFFALATILTLLVFIGEAVRDALDPSRTQRSR